MDKLILLAALHSLCRTIQLANHSNTKQQTTSQNNQS